MQVQFWMAPIEMGRLHLGVRSRNTKAAEQEDGRTRVTYNFVREMTRDQFGRDAAARVNLSKCL